MKLHHFKILAFCIIPTLIMFLGITALMAEEHSRVPGPTIELPTDAKQCIRPAEVMRRDHMLLLGHKRDQTVREGIRTEDASLQGCVDCHVKKDDAGEASPVNAPGQFCSTCHEYTSVKLDCFECHRTTPDDFGSTTASSRILPPNTPEHKNLLAANKSDLRNLQLYLNEVQ
ncbi:MAG: hypothetical protein N2B02_02505 [Amylibacter sp.]